MDKFTFLPDIVKKGKTSIKRGPFGSALKKSFFVEQGYKVYEQKNAINDDFSLGHYYIPEEKFEELKGFEVKPGDIIISCSGTIGKIAVAPANIEKGIINQALLKISLNNGIIITPYFKFWFENYVLQGELESIGAAIKNIISVKELKQIPIPLPPLPEQRRIVAKLDLLFADIDEAIRLLEENITHTEALMGSVLDEIYSKGDTELKEVCIIGPKKSEVRSLDDNLEVSFLPMKDLNEHDINFNPNEIKKISEVYKGYTYFADGDIILAKVTPCFENGKAGLAKDLVNGIGFGSSEYHILRPKDNVLPEWIYFSVLTEQFRVTGKENMTGAGGLKRVPRSLLGEWKIPVPELSIQEKQIKRIVQVQEETKNLESSLYQKLNHLKSLKSSLLDQAFRGEL